MRQVNEYLLAYQYVTFSHAWALKHWALRSRFSLGKYVAEGIGLLIEPILTAKGRRALDSMRRHTANFTRSVSTAKPAKRARAPA
jgi:hypothetical protein